MPPEAVKLSARHQETVRRIFARPLSHNVEWHDVVALLHQLGNVREGRDGRIEVTIGGKTFGLARPRGKDVDTDQLVELRHLLEELGFQADKG